MTDWKRPPKVGRSNLAAIQAWVAVRKATLGDMEAAVSTEAAVVSADIVRIMEQAAANEDTLSTFLAAAAQVLGICADTELRQLFDDAVNQWGIIRPLAEALYKKEKPS